MVFIVQYMKHRQKERRKHNMKKQNVLARLLKKVFKRYGLAIVIVLICIIGQAICSVQGQVSVSYTHLDVYKRQLYDCTKNENSL